MSQFQRSVNLQPAIGVNGDFWGANPRATVIAGEGALVSGPEGLYTGRFAWIGSDGLLYNRGVGAPTGFVAREQQALITTFMAETSSWIPPGRQATLYSIGDFLMTNDGITTSAVGDLLYADQTTGKGAAAVGGTAQSASFTASIAANVAASTCSITANTVTASIAGTTMTVTAVGAGALSPGQTLTGTNVAAGTTVVAQLTGATAGSTGTYQVSIDQTVDSTTVTASGGCLTVVSMTSGLISVGDTLSGGATTSGNKVLANVTGAGAAGKYWVSVADSISSQAITASGGTLTVTAVASGSIDLNEIIVGGTTGSYITKNSNTAGSNVTGTGATGTYKVSVGETVGSTTITIVGNVATKWYIRNVALVGELMKISAYPVG